MNSKHKSNIMIRIAVILLCAVLISSHLASGMLAKYTVGYNGDDYASVAGADIDVVNLAASGDSYIFGVQNNSEVSFNYDVIVTFANDDAAPSVTAAIDDTSVKLNGLSFTSKSADGKVFTFANAGSLDPGQSMSGYALTFDVNDPGVYTDSSITNLSLYDGDFTFTVSVRATQID